MPKRPEADLYIYKSGVFDFNSVYKVIRSWYAKHRFTPFEKVHKSKPSKYIGREIIDEWLGTRKVTGYIRYNIYVEIKAWDVVDVEVPVGKKKVKKQKARIRVRVWSEIETDYEGRFSENRFLEKVRAFYEKYIIKKELETKYDAEIWGMTYDLHGKLKQELGMEAK